MGFGDELMAAGQAQRMYDADPQKRKVAIVDRNGSVRTHELWKGNPVIAMPFEATKGANVQRLTNGVGCRPYLKSLSYSNGAVYANWKASEHIGRLYLDETEQALGKKARADLGQFVVIEPGGKQVGCVNKSWGFKRYQSVVDACLDVAWVQMVYDGSPALRGVRTINAKTFREACGVLASARAYVGPEGGLHHAAAVLNIPAVVIFGGFISPANTGYPMHVNLADNGPGSPCGRWKPCEHCQKAMARITVEQVVDALRSIFAGREAVA